MTYIQRIKQAVNNNLVSQPFRAKDFPFLKRSPSILSKQIVGNAKVNEFFIRESHGLYRLK